jgi:release factor H-coupled RctB family protein
MSRPVRDTAYSLAHSQQRFEERYFRRLPADEYHQLCACVEEKLQRQEDIVSVEKVGPHLVYVLKLEWRGNPIQPVYDTSRHTITTFLPLASSKVTLVGLFHPGEQAAQSKLYELSRKPFVRHVYGLPDLTLCSPCPVGSSVEVYRHIYPKWIGGDIGCGVLLLQLEDIWPLDHRALAATLQARFQGTSVPLAPAKQQFGVVEDRFDDSLGTIGGGNHFAELMVSVPAAAGSQLYLCVHSGSRQFGGAVQEQFAEEECLEEGSPRFREFMAQHDHAVRWAELNRHLIAARFLKCTGLRLRRKQVELTHNFIERLEGDVYVHRKGSIPSNQGPALIPGSRGSFSYLVQAGPDSSLHSLPHGAGRRLSRGDAKQLLSSYKVKDMIKTPLGSYVVTNSKSILVTEHPECYKDLDQIVGLLQSDYGVQVTATFRPLVTVKF